MPFLLVSTLPHWAQAQVGSLSPDPFDEIEGSIRDGGSTPSGDAIEGGEYDDYSDFPTFITNAQDIDAFGRFADGGSDSNWFIGFNNAWIVKLPPVPQGEFQRAFIGAKIGRAKTEPDIKRPWERTVIAGKVYIAISQKPAFSSEQSFFLTETQDIPLEPHASLHMPRTGHSEWFWAEVPTGLVSTTFPNYLIIWSPSPEFRDAAHSPILAAANAGSGPKEEGNAAWNNHSLQGVPPRREAGTLETPITLKPALAIKLTPTPGGGVIVSEFNMRPIGDELFLRFSAEGKNVELAWIEMSQDELEWERVTPLKRTPPYTFSLHRLAIPPRGAFLRGKARDLLSVEGNSKNIFVPGEKPL